MGKVIAWTLIGALLCFGGIVWLNHLKNQDPGYVIGYAVGEPTGGKITLQVMVSAAMVNDSTEMDDQDAWLKRYFTLRDSAGSEIPLQAGGRGALISDKQARDARFFARAELKEGETYTLEFRPEKAKSGKYQHAIPAVATPFQREYFAAAKGA